MLNEKQKLYFREYYRKNKSRIQERRKKEKHNIPRKKKTRTKKKFVVLFKKGIFILYF